MIAEYRQIRNSAEKSPEDVDHWDRLTSKHEGLRCRTGYDKPLNEEGFLKCIIHTCELFYHYPETRCMWQKEDTAIRQVYSLPTKENPEQAMQYRVHLDSGNASALATSMQLAAHPYYTQADHIDSRKSKRQRTRVGANNFSSLRLWQQGRGAKYGAWRNHPSNHALCCNGRVTGKAMNVKVTTLGLWPRAKTIVSRNSWATQMCWNTVHWFMRTDDENPPDIPLDDERLRIDKRRCWSKESYELIRTNPVRRTADKNNPVKRAKTDVDTKREDEKESIKKKVQFQIENGLESPNEDSDEIAKARENVSTSSSTTRATCGMPCCLILFDRHSMSSPEPPKSAKSGKWT